MTNSPCAVLSLSGVQIVYLILRIPYIGDRFKEARYGRYTVLAENYRGIKHAGNVLWE
jgi:hypothetical protein